MNNPLVSVIVTCYNRADMVCTALDSVYAQTYRPLELVIVDDGSKDNSMEVIEAWKASHPDTENFSCKAKTFPNGKLCLARNRGIEMSSGKFIQHLDDDDWMYPEMIAKKMDHFSAHPECDIVCNQFEYIENDTGKIKWRTHMPIPKKNENPLEYVLRGETILSFAGLYRRTALEKVSGWRNGLPFADDADLAVREASVGCRYGMVDESLGAIRLHNCHRQTNMLKKLPEGFVVDLYEFLWNVIKDSPYCSKKAKCLFQRQVCSNVALMKAQQSEYDINRLQQLYANITGISVGWAEIVIPLIHYRNQSFAFVTRQFRKIFALLKKSNR